jgi:iron complex transport system permease protein
MKRTSLTLLVCLALCSLVLSISIGSVKLSVQAALTDASSMDRALLLGLRVPRVALGFVTGASLAMVGMVLQTALRNPLADPFVLGVSGGSALGASLALLLGTGLGASVLGSIVIPVFALMGGGAATLLVLALVKDRSRSADLILAGIVVNSITGGAITLLKTTVSAEKAQELLFWLTGFLDVPSPSRIAMVAVYSLVGAVWLLMLAPKLNLLSLGDVSAKGLGVDPARLFHHALIASSLMTGAVVSVTGLIGFVGLIVPHVARRLYGADLRKNLVPSALLGGMCLVLCDAMCRALFRVFATEPPVGVITALLGGPGFLWILARSRRSSLSVAQ